MRHKICRLLAGGILAFALTLPATAASSASITVQRPAAAGDTVRITLSLEGTSANANAVLCKLGYDQSKLKLQNASLALGSGKAAGNANASSLKTGTAGVVAAEWHDLDAPFSGGEVLTLEFTALTDLTEATFTLPDVQLANMQNGVAKRLSAQTAALTVSGGVTPGDLNGNGKLDSGDLTMLCRILAELDEPSFTAAHAADLNGNGKADSGDLTMLCRILAELDSAPEIHSQFTCSLN